VRLVGAFAGIGGFELAAARAGGFGTVALIEIDTRCQELLRRRFPEAALFGDIRDVRGEELGDVDVLVGGFPCQDISIAGPRAGLRGERSGLFWEFMRLVDETAPRWVVIENVPGLLSSGGRRDMGAVLGALAQRGFGYAYRVLDARGFGLPQRRRRVFIVGRAGGSADGPAEVLDLFRGGERDPVPSRRQGQDVAALTASGLGGGGPDDNLAQAGHLVPVCVRMREGKPGGGKGPLPFVDHSVTLATGNDQIPFQPFQPLGFLNTAGKTNLGLAENVLPPVTASHGNPGMVAQPDGDGYLVRRLTPVECERLQGFPDGWTEGFADTVRYRMLGNAVAVPVAEWILLRMLEVDGA
jgi:DNA (cytosine-5)-methyltransferase 1